MSIPYWLGTPNATAVDNEITTTTTISSITYYNTPVNVVPQVLLAAVSTTTLDTDNPSELLAYTLPQTGWFKTDYQGYAYTDSGFNWNQISQLRYYMKKNNSEMSNTEILIDPQYANGASVSQRIFQTGGGVFPASAGDLLEWTCDADHAGGSPITSNVYGGFGWITLQKIG